MNLDQKNSLLQQLFDHVTESIIVTYQEGKIKLVNPATQNLFGYTQEEIFGKPVEYLMPDRFGSRHIHHRNSYNQNPHSRPMGIGVDLFALKKMVPNFQLKVISHQKKLELLTSELK